MCNLLAGALCAGLLVQCERPEASYVECAGGSRADFSHQGNQFVMSYEEITCSEGKHFAAIHDPEAAGLCPTPRAQILMGHHWAIGAALCKGNHRTPGKHAINETKMDSLWVFNIFF